MSRCVLSVAALFAVTVAAPVWFYGQDADVRLFTQPLTRAVATPTINNDHFVGSRADQLAHFFRQEAYEEKGVVTHRDDTYWPGHALVCPSGQRNSLMLIYYVLPGKGW